MPPGLASGIHKRWPQPQDNRQGIAIACKSCTTPNPQLAKMGKLCWNGCAGYLVDFRRVVLISPQSSLSSTSLRHVGYFFFLPSLPVSLFLCVSLFRMTVMGSEAGKWNKISISELCCLCAVTYNRKTGQHDTDSTQNIVSKVILREAERSCQFVILSVHKVFPHYYMVCLYVFLMGCYGLVGLYWFTLLHTISTSLLCLTEHTICFLSFWGKDKIDRTDSDRHVGTERHTHRI